MSDIPAEALNSVVSYRCLLCRAVTRKIKLKGCPENRQGHIWVHQVHIDNHARGVGVPDHARRLFETYPEATEACFKAAAGAAKTVTATPGSPSKRST